MNLKKNIFMFNKFRRDILTPKQRYALADDMRSQELGLYYFVFLEKRVSSGADQALINKFDEKGIPINKTYIDVTDKEYVYFPISIGQLGLAVFHTYLDTKDDKDKRRFLNFADWFYDNAEEKTGLGVRWMTNVSLPSYHNPGPWQSAFSQSRGISILLRAFQLTQNEKYAQLAKKALISYTIPVERGGVMAETPWGPFYEEYTAKMPTLVLNGMIFSLWGLYDYKRVFPQNKIASDCFEKGINTLEKILPEFDMDYWSRYNLCKADWYPDPDPATIGYQRLHIAQLKVMYKLTERTVFKKYADLFFNQDTASNTIKMYKTKYRALKKNNRL
jgi:hypothetical protein